MTEGNRRFAIDFIEPGFHPRGWSANQTKSTQMIGKCIADRFLPSTRNISCHNLTSLYLCMYNYSLCINELIEILWMCHSTVKIFAQPFLNSYVPAIMPTAYGTSTTAKKCSVITLSVLCSSFSIFRFPPPNLFPAKLKIPCIKGG